jgi:iron complex transport system substrate-binding protein
VGSSPVSSPVHRTGIFFLAPLLLIVGTALNACAANAPIIPPAQATEKLLIRATSEPTSIPPTPTLIDAPAYPQTQPDALGREVTIESAPQAIVSLSPSVTEDLFAIGAGDQVVGRTEFDNYPPEAASLPTIGGFSASSISIEAIVELQPDLVIAGSLRQAEVVEALEAQGITVFTVAPSSLADIEDVLLTLGEITGHSAEAAALVGNMQDRMDAVAAKIGTIPPEEHVSLFYEVWHEPLTTTSDKTFIGEIIDLAGGNNIFGNLEDTYPNISTEEVVERNPEVIVGPSSHIDQLTPEIIAARPGWENISAVTEKRIYVLAEDVISRPGPRVVDALETLASFLYPELFNN